MQYKKGDRLRLRETINIIWNKGDLCVVSDVDDSICRILNTRSGGETLWLPDYQVSDKWELLEPKTYTHDTFTGGPMKRDKVPTLKEITEELDTLGAAVIALAKSVHKLSLVEAATTCNTEDDHSWSYHWSGMEAPICTKCGERPKVPYCGAV